MGGALHITSVNRVIPPAQWEVFSIFLFSLSSRISEELLFSRAKGGPCLGICLSGQWELEALRLRCLPP